MQPIQPYQTARSSLRHNALDSPNRNKRTQVSPINPASRTGSQNSHDEVLASVTEVID